MPNQDAAQAFLQVFTGYIGDRLIGGAKAVNARRKTELLKRFRTLVLTQGGTVHTENAQDLMAGMKMMIDGGGPVFRKKKT
jgi:hypothetical protein